MKRVTWLLSSSRADGAEPGEKRGQGAADLAEDLQGESSRRRHVQEQEDHDAENCDGGQAITCENLGVPFPRSLGQR